MRCVSRSGLIVAAISVASCGAPAHNAHTDARRRTLDSISLRSRPLKRFLLGTGPLADAFTGSQSHRLMVGRSGSEIRVRASTEAVGQLAVAGSTVRWTHSRSDHWARCTQCRTDVRRTIRSRFPARSPCGRRRHRRRRRLPARRPVLARPRGVGRRSSDGARIVGIPNGNFAHELDTPCSTFTTRVIRTSSTRKPSWRVDGH